MMQRSATPLQPGAYYGNASRPMPLGKVSTRQRTNTLAIMMSLMVPWGLYTVVSWILSFHVHYNNPYHCWCLIALCLLVVVINVTFAYWSLQRSRDGISDVVPSWHVFSAGSMVLAFVAGLILGCVNFRVNTSQYYDVVSMNFYPNVDPARMAGQQYMDAGRVMFSSGSRIKAEWSQGFKNIDTYCVAPIVSSEERLVSYDFWAVGKNCCSGDMSDFSCGDVHNRAVHAGMRLMTTDDQQYYRLALAQAEAAAGIKAGHPLFFEWVQDPIGAINERQDAGFKCFLVGTLSHFGLQLFMVILAVVSLTRFGTKPVY